MDDEAIRRHCRPLYSDKGRPSIPPEQLFLALLGGYLMGVTSERRLVMELQCNMALRWFVGLNLNQDAWDHSTFSQNRRRRYDHDGTMQWLFDQTVKKALEEGLVSRHVSADGIDRYNIVSEEDIRAGDRAPQRAYVDSLPKESSVRTISGEP